MDTLNIYYDKIGSTNSEAKNILLKHNIKKALIIAEEQTSGKGRYGNKWISKKHIISSIKFYGNCDYSNYLKKLISEKQIKKFRR